jgi:uncharacterized protein
MYYLCNMKYSRNQKFEGAENYSFFLWGARQTGKSTLLKELFQGAIFFDLLDTDLFRIFNRQPSELRQIVLSNNAADTVVIDEIQKIPQLLNEIHWLIENTDKRYILSGSSPRQILRKGVNLLGGRALRYDLFPLSFSEIPEFDLLRALNKGLMPKHYNSSSHEKLISAYIGSYLEEEILAETKIRDAQIFHGFLEKVAFSNGELINYSNIASDCGVSSPTIKEYFNILRETMLGHFVQPFQKKPKRRILSSPKFYFFDIGIPNHLLKRKNIEFGTDHFGQAFEHFIFLELKSYSHYSGKEFPIYFWRTTSQYEVDFILGDHKVAIEVKGTDHVQTKHLKGLKAFNEEYDVPQNIVISNDTYSRKIGSISIMPWKIFLTKLWAGDII